MNVLSVKGLCKSYLGFSLQNVSFEIKEGTIMGFVGRRVSKGVQLFRKCLMI